MKGCLKALVGFLILFSTPVSSGEVTDKEWIPLLNVLIVTYYHDGEYSEVECIALNQQGKPIGGGSGHPVAGIARVPIYVPTKYVETDLKVSCNREYQEEGSKHPKESESKKAAVKHDLIDEYKAKILAKIKSHIVMPPDLPENPVAEFDVTLLPGGEILDVKLLTSSGFTTFDLAVERAIVLARPLPVPPDPLLSPHFRNLSLKIHYLE